MKKLLVVDSCAHCTYMERLPNPWCSLANKRLDMKGLLIKMPPWCPLPDAKEE